MNPWVGLGASMTESVVMLTRHIVLMVCHQQWLIFTILARFLLRRTLLKEEHPSTGEQPSVLFLGWVVAIGTLGLCCILADGSFILALYVQSDLVVVVFVVVFTKGFVCMLLLLSLFLDRSQIILTHFFFTI